MTTQQFDNEKPILRLTKEQVIPESSLHPIIGSLKNIIPPRRHEALTKAHNELTLFEKQRGSHFYSPTLHGSPFAKQWEASTYSERSRIYLFH